MAIESPHHARDVLVIGVLLAVAFTFLTTFVSNNLHPRFEHRAETVAQQFAILHGEPYVLGGVTVYFPEFQNRVLFPLMLAAAVSPGRGSPTQVYVILRFLTAVVAFLAFWFVLIQVGKIPLRTAAVGVGMLGYVMIFTFDHGWEHPTDFLDILFFSLFLWACVGKHRVLAILLAMGASANRESSPFIGLMWLMLYGIASNRKIDVREAAFGIGLGVLAYATVLSLRYLFGGVAALQPQTVSLFLIPSFVHDFIANPTLSSWVPLLLAMVLPLALWIWANWQWFKFPERRLLWAGIGIALVAPIFGIIMELRFFIPAAVVLIFAVCCAERNRQAALFGIRASSILPQAP